MELSVWHDECVTHLVLDRPERRNALSHELMRSIVDALRCLPSTTEAVVVEASGPVFSAGHDLAEMVGREPSFYDELFAVCTEMMLAMHNVSPPVVAKVQGPATAAGCQLVASCD